MNEHEYYCFLKEFWKVTNDGFIIVDPNGVIVDINETYCEFLGKTREQVLGKPIGEVISTTSMYDVYHQPVMGMIMFICSPMVKMIMPAM